MRRMRCIERSAVIEGVRDSLNLGGFLEKDFFYRLVSTI